MVCEPQTLRRMRTLFLRTSRFIFGASKACLGGQTRRSDYRRSAHLIEDVDEGLSIVTLQRHRGLDTLLRCQHLSEGVWELSGFDVNGHELCEEGILERWNTA